MKIIKPGKKEFIVVCSRCGCEFTYTLDDLQPPYFLKYVKCPDCGNECYHLLQDEQQQKCDLKIFDKKFKFDYPLKKECKNCENLVYLNDEKTYGVCTKPQYWEIVNANGECIFNKDI